MSLPDDYEIITIDLAANQLQATVPLSSVVTDTKQMYLLAHMPNNTSVPLIRVEKLGNKSWRAGPTNLAGGNAIYLPGAMDSTITYFNQQTPIPLFAAGDGVSIRDVNFSIKVSDKNGASFTHDGITFWFALRPCRLPKASNYADPHVQALSRVF